MLVPYTKEWLAKRAEQQDLVQEVIDMCDFAVDATLHRVMLVESYARFVVAENPDLTSSATEEDIDFMVDQALENIVDDVSERVKKLSTT